LLGSEHRFSYRVGSYRVQGKLDLLARDDQGHFLIDWKTGNDEDDLFAQDYALQRRLYAYAALAGNIEEIETIWYNQDHTLESELFDQKHMTELEEELYQDIHAILQADPHAAAQQVQPFCIGCPGTKVVCPVSRDCS
jgi:hypothetical protein